MKITSLINYRLIVYPDFYNWSQNLKRDAEDIKEQILRHVDDISRVEVNWDIEEKCSFCGFDWEVNDNPNDDIWEMNEPVCCEQAREEFKQIENKK